jgi:deferrochelatase/peroxidase EfeB
VLHQRLIALQTVIADRTKDVEFRHVTHRGAPRQVIRNGGYVNPDGSGDPKGLRCPIGAHIRRVNPRDQPVTGQGRPGGSNNSHRLVRRGIPYGPTYVPGQPDDGIERGLLGYFIGSHIENQYEFVLKQWVNDAGFVGAVRLNPKSKDVIIGNNDPAESVFEIRQPGGAPPLKITGFSSFLTTKAAAPANPGY